MKKVAFHNLGCKVNSYELDGIMQMFQSNGYEIVDFAQKADIYIVNTCTVTNIADRKSRQMLHKAKAENPEAIVVATGCYVQTDQEGAKLDEAIDIAVGNNEKIHILEYVEEYLNSRDKTDKTLGGKTIVDLSGDSEYEELSIDKTMEHTRAFIKIQDGCNQFCSYCAIPLARGRVRSRAKDDIIEEVKRVAINGYKEIVLTGIHLSSYGLDHAYNAFANGDEPNEALLDVIEEIALLDGVCRIRLGSLEPRLITDDFLNRLSKVKKVCPHFHLSLQSGSDEVLKRMNRRYTASEFAQKVELLRQYYEHPAITTDIIVGFPMESDEEFDECRRFAEEVDLYEAHVFKYSRRKGTVADKMSGQLTDKIKSLRSSVLMEDSNRRRDDYISYYVGKTIEILLEEETFVDGIRYMTGLSPEYVKCVVQTDGKSGEILKVCGKYVKKGVLFCEIVV